MLTTAAGPEFTLAAGSTVDVSDSIGRALCEGGYAVREIAPDEDATSTPPNDATIAPDENAAIVAPEKASGRRRK